MLILDHGCWHQIHVRRDDTLDEFELMALPFAPREAVLFRPNEDRWYEIQCRIAADVLVYASTERSNVLKLAALVPGVQQSA